MSIKVIRDIDPSERHLEDEDDNDDGVGNVAALQMAASHSYSQPRPGSVSHKFSRTFPVFNLRSGDASAELSPRIGPNFFSVAGPARIYTCWSRGTKEPCHDHHNAVDLMDVKRMRPELFFYPSHIYTGNRDNGARGTG